MFKSFALRIYIVALILRLIPVLLARGLGIGLDDMFQYDMLARSIASGNGYRWYAHDDLKLLEPYVKFDLSGVDYDPQRGIPTSFRPPLYPFFLSVGYLLFGMGTGRFFIARLAQAVLVALLAPLTYYAARKICNPAQDDHISVKKAESVAVLSAWVVALYPMLVVFPLALATENLFIVLVTASFLMLLKTWETPSTTNFILTGVIFGLSALTRSVILISCGLIITWFWIVLEKHRRKVAWMFLALSFTILPWVIRNSLLHHRLAGIETALGYQLYVGYHPESEGTFVFGVSLDLVPILDDGIRDRLGMEKAVEFIREDPARFIRLAFNRLGYFFGLERRALQYFYSNGFFGFIPLPYLMLISAFFLLPFVVVVTSAAFGLATSRWTPQMTMLLLLAVGYLLPHLFIISEERFHMTLVPLLAILAAQFWVNGFGAVSARWRESGVGKFLVILSVLCVALLLTNWALELVRDWDKIAQLLGPSGDQTYFPY